MNISDNKTATHFDRECIIYPEQQTNKSLLG